jgi:hypothetical protein
MLTLVESEGEGEGEGGGEEEEEEETWAERAEMRLVVTLFPLLADLYRQMVQADKEWALQCLAHFTEYMVRALPPPLLSLFSLSFYSCIRLLRRFCGGGSDWSCSAWSGPRGPNAPLTNIHPSIYPPIHPYPPVPPPSQRGPPNRCTRDPHGFLRVVLSFLRDLQAGNFHF